MTQQEEPSSPPVAQRLTEGQLLQLASALLSEEEYAEALSVVQLGLDKGAFALTAAPSLLQISLSAPLPFAFKAVDMLRYMMEKAEEKGESVSADLEIQFCRSLLRLAQLCIAEQDIAYKLLAEAEAALSGKRGPEAHYLSALVKLGQGALPQQLAVPVKLCLAESGGAHGGAWLLLASVLSQQGQHTKAFSALEGGLERAAGAWKAPLWHARARLEASVGDVRSALHCLQQAVAYSSDLADAAASWLLMGHLHLSRNGEAEVQHCITQLDKLAAQACKASALRADILRASLALHRGDHPRAFDTLERALTTNWNDSELLCVLGSAHATVDRSQHHQLLAYANLKRSTEAAPSDAEAWHILGRVCSHLGHDQEACECQAKALRASRFPAVVDFVRMPLSIAAPSAEGRLSS